MPGNKENFIIFLEGVTSDQYEAVEDCFERSLMDGLSEYELQSPMIFDKIPNMFRGLDTWPKRTNLKCWFCDFTFDNIPTFIPTNFQVNDNIIEASPLGNFCTFNCACAYMILNNMKEYGTYLIKLYEIFTNKKIYQILPSPPRTKMTKYGGWWTDMEYLNILKSLDHIQHMEGDLKFSNLRSQPIENLSID